MLVKKVYVNDMLIGEASTWAEVYRLLGGEGVSFMGKPGAGEGPTAFYLSGAIARRLEHRIRTIDETASANASRQGQELPPSPPKLPEFRRRNNQYSTHAEP